MTITIRTHGDVTETVEVEPLVLVREGDATGEAIARGHAGDCARKLAGEHLEFEGVRATVTADRSRSLRCDWCYREPYPVR